MALPGLWLFLRKPMKKVILTLLAVAAILFVSCEKKPQPTPDPGPGPSPEPEPEPEPSYVAPVTIDGDFSDWAKIDASKMCIANCATEPKWSALKVLKVYMDDVYVFFYFEYDDAQIPDKSDVQGHVYFDVDCDESTGGCNNQWDPGCIEYMGEGHFFRNDAVAVFDPSISEWIGEVNAAGWEWETVYASGSGIFNGAGGNGKYEMSLLRESFPELGEEFGFGMDIQQAWNSVGVLPNAELTEDNPTGKSKLMTVKKL